MVYRKSVRLDVDVRPLFLFFKRANRDPGGGTTAAANVAMEEEEAVVVVIPPMVTLRLLETACMLVMATDASGASRVESEGMEDTERAVVMLLDDVVLVLAVVDSEEEEEEEEKGRPANTFPLEKVLVAATAAGG